ncbi:MAG TPA: hypothetical protein VLX92_14190 [Kofleriaceae bacterium]|nr:hypothetical protein [Kofleriaceae bacterium]
MRAPAVVLAIGCGSSAAPQPAPPPSPARPAAAAPSYDLSAEATRLDAIATQLAATEPLDRAAAVTMHRADTADALRDAAARAHGLGARFQAAAAELRAPTAAPSPTIAAVMPPLGAELDKILPDVFAVTEQHLMDEIAFRNDHGCAPIKHCAEVDTLWAAHEYLAQAGKAARSGFDDVGAQLEGLPLDPRARFAIDRATGRGPSYGERCGDRGLCARGLACEAATSTCEAYCSEGAMQPCPPHTQCTTVAGLARPVCRP